MSLSRWSIKSLRRFGDAEILINIYLAIGGGFSMLYAIFAILRTKLYLHVFSTELMDHGGFILHVSLEIILHAILRTVLWLPEIIYALLFQHESLWDWLTATHILKDLL